MVHENRVSQLWLRWFARYGGWSLILLFTLIPIIRWFMLRSIPEAFSDYYSTMSSIGKSGALVGVMLYALNFVLAVRHRYLEYMFGGMNKVYIAHHIVGGLALIFVIIHPLFLALRMLTLDDVQSFREAALFLLPRSWSLSPVGESALQNYAINFGIVAFIGMVILLIVTFFVKLPYHIWLFTHKFLGVAFLLGGLHSVWIGSDLINDTFLKLYMIFWIAIALVAFTYRSIGARIFVRRSVYVVQQFGVIDNNIVQLELQPVGRKLDFLPGQFVFVRFMTPGGSVFGREAHPFSIASSPREGTVRLFVKSLGDYTTTLLQKGVTVGTTVELEGAYGQFSYTYFPHTPQLWVAGGIGATPFLSMARSYKGKPPVTFVYSVNHAAELVDQDALQNYLPAKYPGFRYIPYVADEAHGFLTADKLEQYAGPLHEYHIFICGPPGMMRALRDQLLAKGVKRSRIHTEEFKML